MQLYQKRHVRTQRSEATATVFIFYFAFYECDLALLVHATFEHVAHSFVARKSQNKQNLIIFHHSTLQSLWQTIARNNGHFENSRNIFVIIITSCVNLAVIRPLMTLISFKIRTFLAKLSCEECLIHSMKWRSFHDSIFNSMFLHFSFTFFFLHCIYCMHVLFSNFVYVCMYIAGERSKADGWQHILSHKTNSWKKS